jgi:hypothetical protein
VRRDPAALHEYLSAYVLEVVVARQCGLATPPGSAGFDPSKNASLCEAPDVCLTVPFFLSLSVNFSAVVLRLPFFSLPQPNISDGLVAQALPTATLTNRNISLSCRWYLFIGRWDFKRYWAVKRRKRRAEKEIKAGKGREGEKAETERMKEKESVAQFQKTAREKYPCGDIG